MLSKVTIENVSFPVREPMLAAGQVDAITGLSFSSFIDLKENGVPGRRSRRAADGGLRRRALRQCDYRELQNSPRNIGDAVRGFSAAFTKALRETVRQPPAAIESVLKRNTQAPGRSVELERLNDGDP